VGLISLARLAVLNRGRRDAVDDDYEDDTLFGNA
jgi:hypothetical protein